MTREKYSVTMFTRGVYSRRIEPILQSHREYISRKLALDYWTAICAKCYDESQLVLVRKQLLNDVGGVQNISNGREELNSFYFTIPIIWLSRSNAVYVGVFRLQSTTNRICLWFNGHRVTNGQSHLPTACDQTKNRRLIVPFPLCIHSLIGDWRICLSKRISTEETVSFMSL